MQSSEKRVALVTGANRRIGFEIARQLARKRLKVFLGARDAEKDQKAQDTLAHRGLDVEFALLDVTDDAWIRNAVDRIAGTFGRLDVLVNNAGIMIDGSTPLLELELTPLPGLGAHPNRRPPSPAFPRARRRHPGQDIQVAYGLHSHCGKPGP